MAYVNKKQLLFFLVSMIWIQVIKAISTLRSKLYGYNAELTRREYIRWKSDAAGRNVTTTLKLGNDFKKEYLRKSSPFFLFRLAERLFKSWQYGPQPIGCHFSNVAKNTRNSEA